MNVQEMNNDNFWNSNAIYLKFAILVFKANCKHHSKFSITVGAQVSFDETRTVLLL